MKAADNFLRRTYGDDFSLPLSGVAVHSTQLPGEGLPAWLWNVGYRVPEKHTKEGADKTPRFSFSVVLAPDMRVLMGVRKNTPGGEKKQPKSPGRP